MKKKLFFILISALVCFGFMSGCTHLRFGYDNEDSYKKRYEEQEAVRYPIKRVYNRKMYPKEAKEPTGY